LAIKLTLIFYNQQSEKTALTISRSPIMRVPFFSDKKKQQFFGVRTMLARETMCKIPVNKFRVTILCITLSARLSNIQVVMLRWQHIDDRVIVESVGRTVWGHLCTINVRNNKYNG